LAPPRARRATTTRLCAPPDFSDATEGEKAQMTSAQSDDEMTLLDYAVFFGYIAGFVLFFYGVAAVFSPETIAKG
jgi:hypothetical protein